jgi:hypothetical protein
VQYNTRDANRYAWRSAGVVGKAISWGPPGWEEIASNPAKLALAQAAVAETKRIRSRGIEGDFYPLSSISLDMNVSAMYQFHRRNQNDGFAMVFRRPSAPSIVLLKLEGVDPECT